MVDHYNDISPWYTYMFRTVYLRLDRFCYWSNQKSIQNTFLLTACIRKAPNCTMRRCTKRYTTTEKTLGGQWTDVHFSFVQVCTFQDNWHYRLFTDGIASHVPQTFEQLKFLHRTDAVENLVISTRHNNQMHNKINKTNPYKCFVSMLLEAKTIR